MAQQNPSPSPLHLPEWQRYYQSALREPDMKALFKLIEIAEAAIVVRREALTQSSNHQLERQAMQDALFNLRILKQDRLKFVEG